MFLRRFLAAKRRLLTTSLLLEASGVRMNPTTNAGTPDSLRAEGRSGKAPEG
jgi:hypothetical protein